MPLLKRILFSAICFLCICSANVQQAAAVNAALLISGVRLIYEVLGAVCTTDAIIKFLNGDSVGRQDILNLKNEVAQIKRSKSRADRSGKLSLKDSEEIDKVIYFLENSSKEADKKILHLEKMAIATNKDVKKIKITIRDIEAIQNDIRKLTSKIDRLDCDQRLIGDASYQGECKDGLPHGYGVMSFPDGQMYKGHFKEGLRDGQGTHFFPDGERIEGVWVEGQIR